MRAFEDERYDYYELTKPLGEGAPCKNGLILPPGSIFVHDTDDNIRGSIADGCLKLCWTPTGNCYGNICADTVIFHSSFKNSNLFRRVSQKEIDKINKLAKKIDKMEKQLSDIKNELGQITLKE